MTITREQVEALLAGCEGVTPEMNTAGYSAEELWPSVQCDNRAELHRSFAEPRFRAMLAACPHLRETK